MEHKSSSASIARRVLKIQILLILFLLSQARKLKASGSSASGACVHLRTKNFTPGLLRGQGFTS